MKHLVADIETNGLLEELDRVHCLVIRDRKSGELVASCTDASDAHPGIKQGLDILEQAETIYGHNFYAFDLPALLKVYPKFSTKARVLDTLVIARSRFAHQKELDWPLVQRKRLPGKLAGRHSLEAWGYRLGFHKGDFKGPWDNWTGEMHEYCENDTLVTLELCKHIAKAGIPAEQVETEMELFAYLSKQEENGWPFDMEAAQQLFTDLASKREDAARRLREHFGSWKVSLGMFTPKVNSKKLGYVKGVEMERFKTVEFNPGSRQHIANRLKTVYGWKPTVFTESGAQPQVDEDTLKGLDYPPVKDILDYLTTDKRLGIIAGSGKTKGWMQQVTSAGMIHGRVNQSGAVTHRATHSIIANVPRVTTPYGKEMRGLFHVPKIINGEEWVQLGADASGLELRCLAHRLAKYDNGAYAKMLLEGDVHSNTRTALNLDEFGKKGRDVAKTWKYAWLYGAGDEKLGLIMSELIAPGAKTKKLKAIGKESRTRFLKHIPALKYLVEYVQNKAETKGYLILVDGRKAYTRSAHSSLNTQLQGDGAVICKRWLVEYNRRMVTTFGPQGWDGSWAALIWYHDEKQVALRKAIAEEAKAISISSIEAMTSHFNFQCPLTGEARIGHNWRDCH